MRQKMTLFPFIKAGKWGYIDRDGNTVIDPEYDACLRFSEGLGAVKIGPKYGFITADGELACDPIYDKVGFFREGLCHTQVNGKCSFIDTACVVRISHNFKDAYSFSDGLAIVYNSLLIYNYIDRSGRVILRRNSLLRHCTQGRVAFCATLKGKCGFKNTSNQWIIKPHFSSCHEYHEGFAAVTVQGQDWDRTGFVDTSGMMQIQPQYYTIDGRFSEGLALVFSDPNGKAGFIDTSGNLVIPFSFDVAFHFSDGLARVKKGKLTGFIDKNGSWRINSQYRIAGDFHDGLCWVVSSGRFQYIDKEGRVIWQSAVDDCGLE